MICPQTDFFSYVHRGNLPSVSWVTPTCANSDHAGCDSATGPKWVASLVNAIGKSQYWKSTAIFIFWDDPGGWYDHVPPKMLDYDGLGYRIPMLVVSPYAKKDYVSHVGYEHGSVLRFIEDRFGLQPLSATDKRAVSPALDCFDFGQAPRAFAPIPSTMSERDFLRQPPDPRPVTPSSGRSALGWREESDQTGRQAPSRDEGPPAKVYIAKIFSSSAVGGAWRCPLERPGNG